MCRVSASLFLVIKLDSVTFSFGSAKHHFNAKRKKFSRQPMERNVIAAVQKFIATFLNLEKSQQCTGHCFRRSPATVLVDSGASMTTIKHQFRWKSSTVAERYVDQRLTRLTSWV